MTSAMVAMSWLGSVALGEPLQSFRGTQRRGELGAEVALALVGRAHVGKDHLLEVDIQ